MVRAGDQDLAGADRIALPEASLATFLAIGVEPWFDLGADTRHAPDRTAGMEATAAGRVDRRRDLTLQGNRLSICFTSRVGHRNRAQQGARIGVLRMLIDVEAVRDLHDL